MKIVNFSLELDKLNLVMGCLQVHSAAVTNLIQDIQVQASGQMTNKSEAKESEAKESEAKEPKDAS